MKRRNFLKKVPLLAGASLTLNNIPVRAMTEHSHFLRLAEQSTNDRVLVILQLHGGNDGLNTIIPIEQYDLYYNRRANIAIPKQNSVRKLIEVDRTLPSDAQIGFHPDMLAAKDLYDRGRMAVVQGVSYPRNNGSHFRGRDIQFMGGGPDDFYSSGWIGRYLQQQFAPMNYPEDFPNPDMLDPLAIEMGSDVSLIFHQQGNIPTSISINNPDNFANLVDSLEGFDDMEGVDPRGIPPEMINSSPYGAELNWILGLEDKSQDYASRLADIYNQASEGTTTYPEVYPFRAPKGSLRNPLSSQLQIVSRLLAGGGAGQGVKTKVFLLRIGGFDTHAGQVEADDPTMGGHAAKLYHITTAMQAFQEDLKARGIEDRVLTITTSEFGRRINSNGSFGTDHGTGAPMMIFGRGVKPGVLGTNQDLTNSSVRNVQMQFDYRQVYANILKDWMDVDAEVINNDIFFGDFFSGEKEGGGFFEPLPLISTEVTSTEGFFKDRFALNNAYPNPAIGYTNISFYINTPNNVNLKIIDETGRTVKQLLNENRQIGEHKVRVNLNGLKPGLYFYQIESGILKDAKKLIIGIR